MNRHALIAVVILATMLLSGCVDMTVRQYIKADGTMTGTVWAVLNFTSLYEQQGVTYGKYAETDAQTESAMCPQLIESMNLSDASCRVSYASLSLYGNFTNKTLTEDDGFFKDEGWLLVEYTLTPNMSGMADAQDEERTTMLSTARAQGANIKYVIDMPGRVYYAEGGQITREEGSYYDTAQFDMLAVLEEGKPISVHSRQVQGPLFTGLMYAFLAAMIIPPILRLMIHRRQQKSLYKDKAGTIHYIFTMIILAIVFAFMINQYFLTEGSQFVMGIGVMVSLFASIVAVVTYLGADFEVTPNTITYKSNFATQAIPFSAVRKVERARLGVGLRGYTVTTTAGTTLKPTAHEFRPGRFGYKGVLFTLKDGKTLFYPVKDIGWVIEAVKGRAG